MDELCRHNQNLQEIFHTIPQQQRYRDVCIPWVNRGLRPITSLIRNLGRYWWYSCQVYVTYLWMVVFTMRSNGSGTFWYRRDMIFVIQVLFRLKPLRNCLGFYSGILSNILCTLMVRSPNGSPSERLLSNPSFVTQASYSVMFWPTSLIFDVLRSSYIHPGSLSPWFHFN